MSEQRLVNEIVHYLNSQGHFVWRNNSGLTRMNYTNKAGIKKERVWRSGVRGASDIIGILSNGQFIAIECKWGYNKPTPNQLAFIDDIKNRGGIAGVAKSLDDVIMLIDPIIVKQHE